MLTGFLWKKGSGGLHQGVDIHVEQTDKGVETDEDGEKGENEEIGQFRRGAGHPLGKIDIRQFQGKFDRLLLQQVLQRNTSSP